MSPGIEPIRVLHVEDDPEFADLAATFLERESDAFDVEAVEGAEAGLAALEDGAFDCVVSDYDMPEMNGLAFLEAVRECHDDLPFVLFTGKGSEEIASEAISAGVTDYLQKDAGTDQYAVLANRIENAVRRHRTEEELERTRRRYELMGRASADAFWDWDIEADEVKRSDGYSRIFGFEPEDVSDDLGWWIDQLHPDDQQRVHEETMEAVQGDADRIETGYRVRTPDGTYRDAYTRARIVRDDDGEAVRVVGAVTDMTEAKRRERELEALSDRLELVLDGTDTGVWEWNAETDAVEWDETVERLFGLEPGEFEGTYAAFRRRIHEDDVEWVEAAIDRALDGEERYDVEFRIIRDDGEQRWVHAQGVFRKGSGEQEDRFVGLISDVTDRKNRERELEQYETILETVPDGVFVIDEDAVIRGGNGIASELLGFERHELVDRSFETLIEAGIVDDGIIDRYLEAVRRLLSAECDKEQAQIEYTATVDGEERVFETRIALRPYEDEFRGTIGIIQDITERREREQQRRRSERRFEAIFEDPSAFIGLLEPDGTFVKANDTALEFIGATNQDVAGEHFIDTPWWDESTDEKRAEVAAAIERAADGEFVGFQGFHHGVGGQTIWVEGQIRPVTDEDGSVVSLLVEAIDVTDRLQHEQRIEGLHETTRELVRAGDPATVASIIADANGDILGFPNSVVRFREGGELRPAAISTAADEERSERPVYDLDEGFPGETFQRGEPIVVDEFDADSEDPWQSANRSGLYVPIGDHGTISVGDAEPDAFDEQDVVVAQILANNAAVALDRLEGDQRLRSRERALRRQNERLDRFAGMLSHDLRNPLNVAMGSLELVDASPAEAEHVDRAEAALDRMNDIVDDVLALARQGERVLDPDVVDLAETVEAAWKTIETGSGTLEDPGDIGRIQADGSRLQQLFENLFSNSVEHGAEPGSDEEQREVESRRAVGDGGTGVAVRVGRLDGDGGGFFVEDDGPGIRPEERDAVFEFGRSTSQEGTGLGLAIVEEIAEAHDWTVRATEGATGGARFEVTGVEWVQD